MDLCSFCGAWVSFPCETPCEQKECNALMLPPMVNQGDPMVTAIDQVKHPNHYARWKMEPVEFIAINNLPWWLSNVIKYTMRYDAKDGLKDLYKARVYLDMKIRQIEGHARFWDKPVSKERAL